MAKTRGGGGFHVGRNMPVKENPDPRRFNREPVTGPLFMRAFPTGRFYIKAFDKHFGNVLLSEEQLFLGDESSCEGGIGKGLAPVAADDVPERVRNALLLAAHEAGLEWL